jgi:hypothetical protein
MSEYVFVKAIHSVLIVVQCLTGLKTSSKRFILLKMGYEQSKQTLLA